MHQKYIIIKTTGGVMKKIALITILIIWIFFVNSMGKEVKNSDNPAKAAKGTFDFKLQKVWSIDSAGKDVFAEINMIKVSDDNYMYVHDRKNKRYYIYDNNGKFIKGFGKKGEGPGEIKWIRQARFFLKNNKVLIADVDKINYFSKKGNFINAIKNNYMQKRPVLFLDENTFISAPLLQLDIGKKGSKIVKYNLKTKKIREITEFPVFKGGVARKEGNVIALAIGGLTPMMIIGYHNNMLYYGMNNSYTIHISNMEGKKIDTFSLDRKAQAITDADIRNKFKDTRTPGDMLDMIVKSMPRKLTYFSRIEVHNNLIYVFRSYLKRKNQQQIDIFSLKGDYLYRAFIKVDKGLIIDANPFIKDSHLYLVLEDEEGEVSITKYKIELPLK
jgi:hypothetical protein